MAKSSDAAERTAKGVAGMAAATIGLALCGLGVFMILSLLSSDVGLDPADASKTCYTGLLGSWIAFGAVYTIGLVPSLVLGALVFFWGVGVVVTMRFLATWPQVLGGIVVTAAFSMGWCALLDKYDIGQGGLFVTYLSPPALLYFGRTGILLVAAGATFLGILMAFGESSVLAIRGFAAGVRDFVLGAGAMMFRMGSLLAMLFAPKLAMAGEAAVGEPPAREAGKFRRTAGAEGAAAAESNEPAARTKPIREWKPRAEFKSRFVGSGLDLAIDPDDAVTTRVDAAVADGGTDDAAVKVEDIEEPIRMGVVIDVDAEAADDEAVDASDDAADEIPEAVAVPAEPEPEPEPKAVAEPVPPRPAKARPVRPAPAPEPEPKAMALPKSSLEGYELPSFELLDPPEPPLAENRDELERHARTLEQTLAEFKIDGQVVHIERGPRVTMYELRLAPGIRLSKVTSLADNLAMMLQAQSVRIIAPIPGKNTIGIEIPNIEKEKVSLVDIVKTINREKRKQALPICLGKDVSGNALVADLARMPHLLIAGATGSGKSVCINSIIMSIMMCCRPDEAQMILVDPKVVELSLFKDIPHLMSPVITDMKRAVSVLDWVCQKMDERYEQMSQVSVNNIAKFNALGEEEIRHRLDAFASMEEIEAFPKSMSYMVVVIDELADLMMVAGKEVEHHITRLAAKSRAVGIHLILATQRPSVDVITGLIKANMPCRIAFQVASKIDSRTILDQNGAETLLGQGDMLYLPPGVGKLTRAQGVFVSDPELFRVLDRIKSMASPQYHEDLLGPVIGGGGTVDVSEFDELFLQSGEAIIENQRGSVSLLQRKFGIGYGRASRIIDQLASAGVLGPFRDGKAREILLTMEEFDAKFNGGKRSSEDSWQDDGEDGGNVAGLREDEDERIEEPWDEEEGKAD